MPVEANLFQATCRSGSPRRCDPGHNQPSGSGGLVHISIQTRDLEASLVFYTEQLGFRNTYLTLMRPDVHDGFFPLRYAEVRLGGCVIELLQPADLSRVGPGRKGIIEHIALGVKGIDTVLEHVKRSGAANQKTEVFESPNLRGGARGFFI